MNKILYLYKSLKFNKIINKNIADFSKNKYIYCTIKHNIKNILNKK